MIVERGYLDHWKTNLLRQLTGLPNASELPLRLWEHCEARMDDFIADRDGLVIAGICRAGIDPKVLIVALTRSRWIEKKAGGFLVRGWRERQKGKFASRLNGKSGGRPKKNPEQTQTEPDDNLQVSISEPDDNLSAEDRNLQGGERRGEERSREENLPEEPTTARGRGGQAPKSPMALRIGALFRRRPDTRWSEKEIRSFKAHAGLLTETDLDRIERYYAAERAKGDDGIHRRDLLTFLNNLPGELDRASARFPEKKERGAEPTDWPRAARALWPRLAQLPASFWALDADEQAAVRAWLSENPPTQNS